MTLMQLVFIIAAAGILASAVMAVTTRKLMHAALWLIASLFGVAVIFVLLQAGFFTAVQVVVYIGAIAILIIFAVMLTRRVMSDTGPQVVKAWPVAAIAALGVFGGLILLLSQWSGFRSAAPELADPNRMIAQLGESLVSPNAYVLPFEAASILLLAALVGALYIAWERK
ncbi:MAG TPA: NADH-quinone oxidoreductase subunit J [Anaerolineaceae bacterium]|nr:NADH-quinone oxidoreductase subunit J [Anaerolineaceae bacterium]